jgi:hypothetical protein
MANKIPAYRQGDVILVRVSEDDDRSHDEVKEAKPAGAVLREGEVTGHAHRIKDGSSATLLQFEAKSTGYGQNRIRRFLEVKGHAEIIHEEHGTIVPAPGLYEVVQQREFADGDFVPVRD